MDTIKMILDVEFKENDLDPDFALEIASMINDGVITFADFRTSLDDYCKYSGQTKQDKITFQNIVEENLI